MGNKEVGQAPAQQNQQTIHGALPFANKGPGFDA